MAANSVSFASQEQLARKMASILGPKSKAALAVIDMDRRRHAGKDAFIFALGGQYLVGTATFLNSKVQEAQARFAARTASRA